MKMFCECFKKHSRRIINFSKKKKKLFTNKQQESYENVKLCLFAEKSLKINMVMMRNIAKLEIIGIIQISLKVLHIVYVLYDIVYLNKLLHFFAVDQTMIIILS